MGEGTVKQWRQRYNAVRREGRARAKAQRRQKAMVGEQIRAFRANRQLSQQTFAELCGLWQATLSRWERGIGNADLAAIRDAFPDFPTEKAAPTADTAKSGKGK